MIKASEWFQNETSTDKPWLILGKGPTFRKAKTADLSGYHTIALNHVAREMPCDAVLLMDLDVLDVAGEQMERNAQFFFLPWHPHIDFQPAAEGLDHFIERYPVLQKIEREGRLVVFNAETAKNLAPIAGEPTTQIKFSSAEAALNLLANNGVKSIRTLGVDGGNTYANKFDDLNSVTLLKNGQQNFERQFEKFSETLRRHPDLTFGPLTTNAPVRIFIGGDPTQVLGAKMFEYSVRQYASMSVKCEIINNDGLPVPADPNKRARTGFSFCRFKIPELCNYRGRAIYVDADMQVFTDIKDLWTRDFEDSWLLYSELPDDGKGERIPQYSVMLLDCAKLDWDAKALVASLERDDMDYPKLMHHFSMMPSEKKLPLLDYEWNSLEHYEENKTKLIHYTDMPTQPWVSHQNPNGELWYSALRDAIRDEFVSLEEIYEEIHRGHISPLLPEWAGLPALPNAKQLAKDWVPPFRRFIKK
ncbi:MAG: glycosyltransferase [Pseudomonadota bacterium]